MEKKYREKVRKDILLKEVWDECSFDEIIDFGFVYGKCSSLQLVEAADKIKNKDKTFEDIGRK